MTQQVRKIMIKWLSRGAQLGFSQGLCKGQTTSMSFFFLILVDSEIRSVIGILFLFSPTVVQVVGDI